MPSAVLPANSSLKQRRRFACAEIARRLHEQGSDELRRRHLPGYVDRTMRLPEFDTRYAGRMVEFLVWLAETTGVSLAGITVPPADRRPRA